jgi:pyruvate formate lyase activating enzyme
MAIGTIFDVREMTLHDGPGLRTTVFLKGCPLRCAWCHNPEGQSFEPELMVREGACRHCGACREPCGHPECAPFGRCARACPEGALSISGRRVEARELAEEILPQKAVLLAGGGGVTLSGGEPLSQPDFAAELATSLKPLHVAVETSGYASPESFELVLESVDLVIFDIKLVDPEAHRAWTGARNEPILANLRLLIASGRRFVARVPLIPTVNDDAGTLREMAGLLVPARDRVRVELLPYNRLAGAKYPMVGRPYNPGFDEAAPRRSGPGPFLEVGLPCRMLRI